MAITCKGVDLKCIISIIFYVKYLQYGKMSLDK